MDEDCEQSLICCEIVAGVPAVRRSRLRYPLPVDRVPFFRVRSIRILQQKGDCSQSTMDGDFWNYELLVQN